MTILHAGEIGRLNEVSSILDTDDLTVLRAGVLYRVTAEVLAAYIVAENTTTKEITFADSPYTVTNEDDFILANATSGNIVINLRPLEGGGRLWIKKMDATVNTVTINPVGSTIDGQVDSTISTQYVSEFFVAGPNEWGHH